MSGASSRARKQRGEVLLIVGADAAVQIIDMFDAPGPKLVYPGRETRVLYLDTFTDDEQGRPFTLITQEEKVDENTKISEKLKEAADVFAEALQLERFQEIADSMLLKHHRNYFLSAARRRPRSRHTTHM